MKTYKFNHLQRRYDIYHMLHERASLNLVPVVVMDIGVSSVRMAGSSGLSGPKHLYTAMCECTPRPRL